MIYKTKRVSLSSSNRETFADSAGLQGKIRRSVLDMLYVRHSGGDVNNADG